MKKKFTLVLSALLMVGLVYDYNYRMAHTNSAGANPGNTGSPGDGMNCATSCHIGGPSQTTETMEVGSDIPAGGYVGGMTYNVTVTMTGSGVNKFGFQLSAQDVSGNGIGTLISGTGSQVVSTKYITHTAAGTSGSGTKTWTFQWTAPTAGTGDVTVYYAGNFSNSNGATSGDVIVTGSLVVEEATTGISEAELAELSVYPNPVIDEINVAAKDVDEEIMFTMYNMNGQKVLEEKHEAGDISIDVSNKNLSTGVYFLQLEVDNQRTIKKLLVK